MPTKAHPPLAPQATKRRKNQFYSISSSTWKAETIERNHFPLQPIDNGDLVITSVRKSEAGSPSDRANFPTNNRPTSAILIFL